MVQDLAPISIIASMKSFENFTNVMLSFVLSQSQKYKNIVVSFIIIKNPFFRKESFPKDETNIH